MDALADKGTLTKKTFGKALVYWYAQEGLPAYSPEELVTHRAELKALKATAAQLGQDLASRAAELNALKANGPGDLASAGRGGDRRGGERQGRGRQGPRRRALDSEGAA